MLRERDRAFSWDVCNEEQLHCGDMIQDRANANKKKATIQKPIKVERNFENNHSYLHPMEIKTDGIPNNKRDFNTFLQEEMLTPKVTDVMAMTSMTMLPSFINVHQSCGETRIGAYTKEERQQVLERFRAKKQRRVWRKQIKYDCRKRLADTRPRVKGRFVSRKGMPLDVDEVEDIESECSNLPDCDIDSTDSP
jgi:hypothetical protein